MSIVAGTPVPGHRAATQRRLFLRFAIGADTYVLDTHEIVQVLPLARYKQMPGMPAWVAGLAMYHGRALPVIDMTALATGAAAARLTSTRVVVVDSPTGADANADADRRAPLGLILEKATETAHYDPAAFLPSGLDHRDAPYLGPVLDTGAGLLQWLRVDDLVPVGVRERLFGAAAEAGT
ncbi:MULTISPECIES: chemotaxis protein CheW [unclassified Achromobacter]|uniref:chemotaxis protein CheW n=1 Tax=unclassified Achromobacter TaxID=2626865 RepID=UPI000B51DCD9|nr:MULTISPECIES: chemotaxis protein CheW [unclassified Achromobacter]OWT70319.1 chemotaxis protein CheW [Achromobacter sp. HZ34]OWT71859.1 chemotaxis protein CheW [Achromobacter sp. HZ28]